MKKNMLLVGFLLLSLVFSANAEKKDKDVIKLNYVNYPAVPKGVDFDVKYEYDMNSFKCNWKSSKKMDKDIAMKAAKAELSIAKKALELAKDADAKKKANAGITSANKKIAAAEKKTNKFYWGANVTINKKVVIVKKGTSTVLAESDWTKATWERKQYKKFTDQNLFNKYDKNAAEGEIKSAIESKKHKPSSDQTAAMKSKLTTFKARTVSLPRVDVKGSKKKIADILTKVEELDALIDIYNYSGTTSAVMEQAKGFAAFFGEKIAKYEPNNKKAIINKKNIDALVYFKAISEFMTGDYDAVKQTITTFKRQSIEDEIKELKAFFNVFKEGFDKTGKDYTAEARFVAAQQSIKELKKYFCTNLHMQKVFELPVAFNFYAPLPAGVAEYTYSIGSLGEITIGEGTQVKKKVKPKCSAKHDALDGFVSKVETNSLKFYSKVSISHSPTFGKGFSSANNFGHKYAENKITFWNNRDEEGALYFNDDMQLIKAEVKDKTNKYVYNYENGLLTSAEKDGKAIKAEYDKADLAAWKSVKLGDAKIKREIKMAKK